MPAVENTTGVENATMVESMTRDENRLFILGGTALGGSGLFWAFPGLNGLGAVAGISGLTLIIARLGYGRGLMASLIGLLLAVGMCTLTLGLLGGILSGVLFAIIVLLPGLAMGNASRNFASAAKTVWRGLLPIFILMACLAFFYPDVINNLPESVKGVNGSIMKSVQSNPDLSKMVANQYGNGADWQDKFLAELDKIIEFMIKILPGTLIVGFIVIIVASLILTGAVASRYKLMVPRFRPFHLWRANDWWLLPTVLGLAFVVFAPNDFWRFLGGNLLIVCGHIYAVVGLAVTEAFFKRLFFPKAFRIIFYIAALLISIFSLIFFALLGVADSRFNFKREIENIENENGNIE